MNHAPNQNDWSAAYTSLSGSWAPNIQNATVNGHMHNDVSSDSAISHAYDVPQVSLHGNLAYTTGQALSPQTHNGRTTPSTMVPMTPDMQHFNSYLSHDYPASHSHNLNPYSFPCQAMVPTAAANPWADAAYTLGTQIRAADHNRRISPAHEYQSPQLCPQLPRPVPDHHSANAYSHHDLSSNQVNTAQYEPTTMPHASMFAQAWLPVSAPAFPTTTSSSLTAPVITETQPSIKSSHMESVANAILRLTERTKQTVQQEQSVQPAHEIPPTPPGLASASSSSSSWMSSSSQLAEISSSGSLVTAQLIDSVPSTPVASTSGTRTEESMGKDLGWLDTIHENLEIGSDGRPRKQRRMKGEPPRDLAQRRYACDLCTDEPRLFARPSALKIHMVSCRLAKGTRHLHELTGHILLQLTHTKEKREHRKSLPYTMCAHHCLNFLQRIFVRLVIAPLPSPRISSGIKDFISLN